MCQSQLFSDLRAELKQVKLRSSPEKKKKWFINKKRLLRDYGAKGPATGFIHIFTSPHNHPARDVLSVPFYREGN